MNADQVEQIKRILEPAIRETLREVMEDELRPFVDRVAMLEREVAMLKESRGKLFGIWTLIVFIVSIAGKAVWDLLTAKLGHKP